MKDEEKYYICTECKKRCVPIVFIKSKNEKERCYCKKCIKKIIKPDEF